MQRRFFSGDSLAQAINQAAQHFQLPPGEIDYKVIDKRHGFLKVRRKVLIEVDETNPRKEPEVAAAPEATPPVAAPARAEPRSIRDDRQRETFEDADRPDVEEERDDEVDDEADDDVVEAEASFETAGVADAEDSEPAEKRPSRRRRRGRRGREGGSRLVELADAPRPAKSRYEEATGEEVEAVREALEKVLKLADLVLESEILQAEEALLIELRGADQDLLLRDRGRLLLAIQHLLPRIVRGLIGHSVVCKVDSDNYHEIREERLRDMAQRAADEVRHHGRPRTLEPMSPDERRIVHLTLADYPGVETESHGSGLFKRVMVRGTGGRSERHDSYRR